jgi:hypothetical protein
MPVQDCARIYICTHATPSGPFRIMGRIFTIFTSGNLAIRGYF